MAQLSDIQDNGFYELKLGRIGLSCEEKREEVLDLFNQEDGSDSKEEIELKMSLEVWRTEVKEALVKERILVVDDSPNVRLSNVASHPLITI